MKKVLINYATNNFKEAQKFNSHTALKIGGFDEVFSFGPMDIDPIFYKKNQVILEQSRGAGYWLWKPYFILKTLELISDNDVMMYCDSGSHFIASAEPLFNLLNEYQQDLIPFSLDLIESHWTKRDTFVYMDCDRPEFTDTYQCVGSFIIIKKNKGTVNFVNEYIRWCLDENILTDIPNRCGLPDYPGFMMHRHDQSIFSLLCKRHGFIRFRDPSQWGNKQIKLFINSAYPQIVEHTRQKSPKQAKLKYKIKRLLKKAVSGLFSNH